MNVSFLVEELTAIPSPRAELTTRRFVPMLPKTAYPADFWTAARAAGCSLYNSFSVSAAILRIPFRSFSGSSFALTTPTDTQTRARTAANIFSCIGVLLYLPATARHVPPVTHGHLTADVRKRSQNRGWLAQIPGLEVAAARSTANARGNLHTFRGDPTGTRPT